MEGPYPQPKHRELSKAEVEQLSSEAFALERKIVASLKAGRVAAWELAEHLYEFHEGACWGLLGYDTLDEFLASPDIAMARSTFFRLTKTWRDLVVVRGVSARRLSELEPRKVADVVRPVMRGEASVDDALADVETLGHRDLVEKYQGPRHPHAPLDAEDEPVRVQCPTCGSWYVPRGDGGGDDGAAP